VIQIFPLFVDNHESRREMEISLATRIVQTHTLYRTGRLLKTHLFSEY